MAEIPFHTPRAPPPTPPPLPWRLSPVSRVLVAVPPRPRSSAPRPPGCVLLRHEADLSMWLPEQIKLKDKFEFVIKLTE